MIGVILALCLIWNTAYLLSSRRETYTDSWVENYEAKFIYSKPTDWGFYQVLIVPKNRGLPTTTIKEEN